MSRRSIAIGLIALALVITVPSAYASLSIVADLDSNATNGPDTLQIEPTDTLLVRLWFTGTDSSYSYGVTLGDTLGALSWVEEPAATVYNSPSGWTNTAVQEDSLGWLLLQASDFTFQRPIHPPHEFARLKFFVTPGDSCGTLEGDLDQSGWFNIALGEGSFTSFEGPTICVDSVLDGGEEDGGGEGGDDEVAGGGEGGGLDGGGNECDTLPCCDYVEDKPETGRVWVVNDDGTIGVDCDCNQIQACIDSAIGGDTVCVNPGSYSTLATRPYRKSDSPTGSYDGAVAVFSIVKDDIVVRSSAGPDVTFIGKDTTIAHVCFLMGDTTNGKLQNVVVGGFSAHSGSTGALFPGQAFGAGALFCTEHVDTTVVIAGNVFMDNKGPHGAAIRTYGEPKILDNVFRHNRLNSRGPSTPQGGAIQITGTPPSHIPCPIIEGNWFDDNGYDDPPPVSSSGGAISFEDANGVVLRNYFVHNRAGGGGAIRLAVGSSHPTIAFNVFDRCKASVSGGAIGVKPSDESVGPEIYNNTFVLNIAPPGKGGGFYANNPGLEVNIRNNIFAYTTGGAVVCETMTESLFIAFACNDFYANVGGDVTGIPDTLMTDIVYEDPVFCSSGVSCSLWAIDPSSPCAPESTCDVLIGASDTCSGCIEIATSSPQADVSGYASRPLDLVVMPNPFNATLEIQYYAAPGIGRPDLSIYDVRGRIVCRFPERRGGWGWYGEDWLGRNMNGQDVPSGVYLVEVRNGQDVETRKVILVR